MRVLVTISSLVLIGVLAFRCGPSARETETEIMWDSFGVPHIRAPDLSSAFYAQGWAQARNHGDLILRLYAQARGRGAEFFGPDYLEDDRWVHIMNVPTRAAVWYLALEAEERAWLDAFANGINDYVQQHPDRIDAEAAAVLPVTGTDLLAHQQRVINLTFVVHRWVMSAAEQVVGGSNAWAIAPSRAASGHAMLLANPHLPWRDLFLFFESHIRVGDLRVYGATLVGNPGITIGFTDRLGWTHTVNTHDGYDLYRLTLEEDGYLFDGEKRFFEQRQHTIRTLTEEGTLEEEVLVVRESVHGPVIATGEGEAVAVRAVGLGKENHLLQQYVDMWRAQNLEEFEAAISRLQMPMFTVMYADRDGRIMHLFGGEVPKRAEGGWEKWNGGLVDGDESDELWRELHTYAELPRVVDPPTGWLQNANDPPWTTTFPLALDADDFPEYMAPRFMHYRAQSSARILAEDDQIDFEELVAYKHDSRMVAAERYLDDLAVAVGEHGDETAKRALTVLEKWDRQARTESKGAVLFADFFERLIETEEEYFETPWQEQNPRTTPDGFADPAAVASLLSEVGEALETAHGSMDVAWGEVYRFRVADGDYPANGGPGLLGIFRVFGFTPDEDGKRRVVHGDTFVAAVEFSDPVRARVLMSYGNASQPDSPHRTDQLPLLAAQKLREAWLTEDQIRANLAEREVLEPR